MAPTGTPRIGGVLSESCPGVAVRKKTPQGTEKGSKTVQWGWGPAAPCRSKTHREGFGGGEKALGENWCKGPGRRGGVQRRSTRELKEFKRAIWGQKKKKGRNVSDETIEPLAKQRRPTKKHQGVIKSEKKNCGAAALAARSGK